MAPLRLLIYDRTCLGADRRLPLSAAWWSGGWLYQGLRRLDHCRGVASWPEALDWLATAVPERPISEIQFWGHGRWGRLLIDGKALDRSALTAGHPLEPTLATIRKRLIGPQALWWFRTCETFGADPGLRFAQDWTRYFGCQAAGHTHVIGFWQSGLHLLQPGEQPSWSPREGLLRGEPAAPQAALSSGPRRPHTITCFHGAVPEGFRA